METNLFEIINKNCDYAGYTGIVTVSTCLGDRLIQTETSHNAGLTNLFKFIGNCLQGKWYEAKFNRPCKILLLKEATGEEFTGDNKSTPASKPSWWGEDYKICNPVMYDTAANMTFEGSGENASCSVTYHFRIPFLSLEGGSNIKKLLLLPATSSDYATDACAYYVLPNAITVPEAGHNFTVIIDWTLKFTNTTATEEAS